MKKIYLLITCVSVLALFGTPALALSPSSFEVGVQISDITYKEPGIMKESGFMYGLTGAYSKIGPSLMWKVDGTLTTGKVDYVGSYSDGTPLTITGITDRMFETRALLGPTDFVEVSSYYLPYIGIGYRYLFDGANKAPGGYRRESNYVYIPLGVEGLMSIRERWSMVFTLEYDFFVSGTQVSYLSDVDPGLNNVENTQSSGYGYRASLKFILEGKQDLGIEPFLRYWKIGKSDTTTITFNGVPVAYGYEPANNSTEIGMKVMLKF